MKLMLGGPRSHSVRDKWTIARLQFLKSKSGSGSILLEVTIKSRSTTLKSLDLSHKAVNRQSPQSSTAICGQ